MKKNNKLDSSIERFKIKVLFTTSVRLSLYMKISSFLEEGIPLNDILEKLREQYVINNKSDIRISVISIWLARLSSGMTLSESISDMVPPGESMLIKAGERSGDITTAFKNAIMTTEATKKMIGTLVGKLSYPAVLITMLSGLIYVFSTSAIPELASVLDPEEWPDMSKALYNTSMFVQNYWYLVLIAIFSLFTVSIKSLPVYCGPARKYLDKLPPWSIYKTFQGSVFLISISSMMKSGISVYDAIKQIYKQSPKYVQKELSVILKKLDVGIPVGEALNSGFLDTEIGMDVEIYGQLSNIQKSIGKIGQDSVVQGIKRIEVISELISNMVLMCIAVYVGWVYYSFYVLTKAMGEMAGMS